MNKRIFKGHIGIGDAVQGEALVANDNFSARYDLCLLYTSPSPRDATLSRMPSSA